jgi:hypothetical protein
VVHVPEHDELHVTRVSSVNCLLIVPSWDVLASRKILPRPRTSWEDANVNERLRTVMIQRNLAIIRNS